MTDKAEYRKALQDKRHKHKCFEQLTFTPQIHRTIPDFQNLQQEVRYICNKFELVLLLMVCRS